MERKMDNAVINLTNKVKWIGVLDYDIKTFDIVMTTENGTTYNSYFIEAEKKVIIETVKEDFFSIYLEKIQAVTQLEQIDYIILNHTEPDHSGSLASMLKIMPNVTVVGSSLAIKYLNEIVNTPFKYMIVKDGDKLDIGGRTLRFISAPNLHWPDSMYTYLEEEKILFSCDSFGAHYCNDKMIDSQINDYTDSFDYYFNVILKPYSKFMLNAIEKIQTFQIKFIAPGHGPIIQKYVTEKIDRARYLSERHIRKCTHERPKALIAYVSAHDYTREMAMRIAEGIMLGEKIDVEIVDLEHIKSAELDCKITLSDALLIGSPTINQNTLMPIYKMFSIINPIRDRGKLAMAFGSYGWSGEAITIIENTLKNLKLSVLDSQKLLFKPSSSDLQNLQKVGKEFAEQLLTKMKSE